VRRRVGYGLVALGELVLLVLLTVAPGWRALPFVTEDARSVVPLVTLSLIVAVLVSGLKAVAAHRWSQAAGEFVNSTIAVVMLYQLWHVFPFAFPDQALNAALVAHVIFAVGIAACVVSMVVQTVILAQMAVLGDSPYGYAAAEAQLPSAVLARLSPERSAEGADREDGLPRVG